MEKKSLGRGLEDISDIFLSKSEEQEPKRILNGFSSVKLRDEMCDSGINSIVSLTGEYKCKIFSQDHEKHGVAHIDSIIPIYANFCEYFNPVTLNAADKSFEERSKSADIPETECEVEKTIRVGRKIAYPNSEGGQKNIRKTIFEYLE
jgi:hypothetical protein